mmetsp:Transcript_28826/g.72534  ORF Transcript_28826/g.72534 Transcript_28826/m.72534 type:complete len:187 (+) Transcript_28826:206-766(+)|eukprot:CAMPEP_0177677636 /NCGR_PEP_ID=MMETSP0447-20121125/28523_1 /TAXON_ID=0 /ORGANISM="Stygamoeba regulata, Strain BSH-02190019" /LENGTH=186 /DNA_ID=CAMNT_0019186469 /DNA_START=79 /DNA_END=639 /DNA_ORIENTATION=+
MANALKQNVETQLNRLLAQLQDLEDLKDALTEEEYETTKQDTHAQIKEFYQTLERMSRGDVTLVNELQSVKLAMQATISKAFKTPEIIKYFAKKQPDQLRQKIRNLHTQLDLKSISRPDFSQQKIEALMALRKLGEKLTDEEVKFIVDNSSQDVQDFEAATSGAVGAATAETLLKMSGSQILQAQK